MKSFHLFYLLLGAVAMAKGYWLLGVVVLLFTAYDMRTGGNEI
jgi:hypothetical protein